MILECYMCLFVLFFFPLPKPRNNNMINIILEIMVIGLISACGSTKKETLTYLQSNVDYPRVDFINIKGKPGKVE